MKNAMKIENKLIEMRRLFEIAKRDKGNNYGYLLGACEILQWVLDDGRLSFNEDN